MVLFDCVCFYLVGLGWFVLLFIVVDCLFWWVGLVRRADLFCWLWLVILFGLVGGLSMLALLLLFSWCLDLGVRLDCLGFCECMFV